MTTPTTRELTVAAQTWNTPQMEIIKRQIAPGIDAANLEFFAAICRRVQLDPFTKQIYCIQRGGKWTIQTGIDGYRLIAARTGDLAGIDDAEYDTEDSNHPAWARVTVWRFVQGQRVPFTAKARYSEYKPAQGAQMWDRMPYLMLAKCAEALALRKAFPAELSGVYTGEEMMQAADPLDTRPTPPRPIRPAVAKAAPAVVEAEPAMTFAEAEPSAAPEPETDLNGKTTLEDDQQPGNGYGPATAQQRAAIEKLCIALGKPVPGGEMTYTQGRLMIASLSADYGKSRREKASGRVEHDLRELPMAAHGSH